MKLTLRLADHDTETGQSRTLETGRLTIGRGPENDWVLADPDRTLSKNHCRVDASEGGFMLTDLSTNGVFLSGASCSRSAGASPARWSTATAFALGPYRMQAEIEGGEGLPAGELGLPQSEVDAIFLGGPAFGNGGRPPPIAPTIPEGCGRRHAERRVRPGPPRRARGMGGAARPRHVRRDRPVRAAGDGTWRAAVPDDPFRRGPSRLFATAVRAYRGANRR